MIDTIPSHRRDRRARPIGDASPACAGRRAARSCATSISTTATAHALKDVNLDDPGKAQSPRSSVPRAAANRRCCASSTASMPSTRSRAPNGEVLLDGENILDPQYSINRLRTQVGMVFQKPVPFPMTIYDNVAYALRHYDEPLAAPSWTSASKRRSQRGALGRGEGQAAATAPWGCPAANSSACASPAPSPSSLKCCCWMSRPRHSIRSPPPGSSS